MKYSTLRLLSGAIIIASILISQSLFLRLCITIFIIILASKSGRKFRLLPNVILLVTISLAHTLTPHGRVFFSIGSYPITIGALSIGANKALLLISFIYASHYMMSTRAQIPGKLGALISLQFYYFDQLASKWNKIEKKRPLIYAIDQLLLGIEEEVDKDSLKKEKKRYVVKKDVWIHTFHILVIILLFIIFSDWFKSLFPFISLLP